MRLSTIAAIIAAGALLAGSLATNVHGGWFGLGGSDKSSDASKSKTASAPDKSKAGTASAAKTAKAAPAASNSSSKSLFGLGGTPTASKPDPKKKNGLYASKQKKPEKSSGSWWNSWTKPKQPASPKTTGDWMKLKQVQY